MKKNIATIAVAAIIGLSALSPAAASMRLSPVDTQNAEIITVGSHSHGGHYGGGNRYKRPHYRPQHRQQYRPHYRPTRHTHYHCHKRFVHGYWKNVCHVARHNIHGNHHSYKYH